MEILNPNIITLVFEFKNEYIGKADTNNAFRRALVHGWGETEAKIRPKADMLYNDLLPGNETRTDNIKNNPPNILYPLFFGLIKNPEELDVKSARGVIMIYEYLGLPDYLENFKDKLETYLANVTNNYPFSKATLFKLIIAKEI